MVETARTVFFAAKGPFVAFSHTVASRLISMPEIDADEAHALGERKSARLRHYMTGRLYNGTAGMHPRKFIVYDDVYFGYLALRAFRDDNLTLVQARLSEFDKGLATRLHTQRGHVRIFHKVTDGAPLWPRQRERRPAPGAPDQGEAALQVLQGQLADGPLEGGRHRPRPRSAPQWRPPSAS